MIAVRFLMTHISDYNYSQRVDFIKVKYQNLNIIFDYFIYGATFFFLKATDLDKDRNGEITYHIRGANSVYVHYLIKCLKVKYTTVVILTLYAEQNHSLIPSFD